MPQYVYPVPSRPFLILTPFESPFVIESGQNPRPTYKDLLQSIRGVLETKYSQKPQLSASHPIVRFPTSVIWIGVTNADAIFSTVLFRIRALFSSFKVCCVFLFVGRHSSNHMEVVCRIGACRLCDVEISCCTRRRKRDYISSPLFPYLY